MFFHKIYKHYNITFPRFDTMLDNISIYIVNYKDDVRRQKMINRFAQFQITPHFVDPVEETDHRMDIPDFKHKRTAAIMLQHLDSIRHFIDHTSNSHCIVCEDDIMISKDFYDDMPNIISTFEMHQLDVLLLGYLWPYKIDDNNYHFSKKHQTSENNTLNDKYTFRNYPNDLWGSQMYLISRDHAMYLLETFTMNYAVEHQSNPPYYNPDWTLTKSGNRAILYPMLAVEEGDTKTEHSGQNDFHRSCFLCNYDPSVFLL